MFQTSNPNMDGIECVLKAIPKTITRDQNSVLTKCFTQEEIFGVIKNMHPTKAPGADGIQEIFFLSKVLGYRGD